MAKYSGIQLDNVFSALADSTRRRILARLAQGDRSVSELWAETEMKMPSFMKHIWALEEAGLIVTEKRGRIRQCKLDKDTVASVQDWALLNHKAADLQLEQLGDFLAGYELDTEL